MIIDAHTHMAFEEIYPHSYLDGMVEGLSIKNKEKLYKAFLSDKYCERMIRQMDEAMIDKAILLIIDGGVGLKEPKLPLNAIFELHNEVLSKHNERFIVFAGIDPRRGDSGLRLFEKSITDFGFKGLKLYPPMGYAMDSKELFAYYEICAQNNLAVLIHTGPSLKRLKNEYGDPDCMYKLANRFPGVNFILAHAGYKLLSLADKRVLELPNIFFDIAGFQTRYKAIDKEAIDNLGVIFSAEYNSKVLFGTDWPLFNIINPLKDNVYFVSELYRRYDDSIEGGLENVLYKNALMALRI